jgi:putative lipoprotein
MARAAIGVACLSWSGGDPALAGADTPPEAVRRTAASTDQPDFAAYERKVEGLRRELAALDRIEGQYIAGDHSATYVAFGRWRGPDRRRRAVGSGRVRWRRGSLSFHARRPDRSRARGLSNAGAPSDGWYERAMTLYFEPERFVGGRGTINGRPAEPDEHEVRGAWRQAEAVKVRIAAARVAGAAIADANRARYACIDGSAFAVAFDVAGARAVVEFLGREPIVLPRVEVGTRFVYADDHHRLRGEGEEALWEAGDLAPVPCTLAASSTPLRLAPGNYPLFEPAAKSADDWSRFLLDLMPAINTCLRAPVGDLPRVIRAWPMNHGMVGACLQNIDGGRHQCIAAADGSAIDRVELLGAEAERPPRAGNSIFTPADGAYPGGACFRHERVETKDGRFLGWLSVRTC